MTIKVPGIAENLLYYSRINWIKEEAVSMQGYLSPEILLSYLVIAKKITGFSFQGNAAVF